MFTLYTIKYTHLDKTVLLPARPLQHLMIVIHNIGLVRYHNLFEELLVHQVIVPSRKLQYKYNRYEATPGAAQAGTNHVRMQPPMLPINICAQL